MRRKGERWKIIYIQRSTPLSQQSTPLVTAGTTSTPPPLCVMPAQTTRVVTARTLTTTDLMSSTNSAS
jgi:hypothetical protein